MSYRLRATLVLVTVVALSALMFAPQVAYADSGQWVKYSGTTSFGPSIVVGPTASSWDSAYTTSPRVLYEGNTFRMWYNGGDMSGSAAIGYAFSSDGISWTKGSTPVLTPGPSGSWDSATVSLGSVMHDGSTYMMYYRGTNPTTYESGAIGLATSKDGVTWTKYAGNPILTGTLFGYDQGYIASPWVVKMALTYNMWYTGKNSATSTATRILFATSMDGISWAKWNDAQTPVLSPSTNLNAWDSGAVYSPAVYFNGTTFALWYTGLGKTLSAPQIGIATSPDGSTWTRSSFNPILSPGGVNAWDSSGVEQPSLTLSGNNYMLYYDGLGTSTPGRIGLAQTSQSPQIYPVPEFPSIGLLLGVMAVAAMGILRLQKKRD